MVGTRTAPLAGGGDNLDRLARVVEMVNDAVDLLNRAVDEIKGEKGHEESDERDAAGAPERNTEQPG